MKTCKVNPGKNFYTDLYVHNKFLHGDIPEAWLKTTEIGSVTFYGDDSVDYLCYECDHEVVFMTQDQAFKYVHVCGEEDYFLN